MINVTLKDGSVIQVEKGSTLLDVAAKISEGFARKVLSATVDGKVRPRRHAVPRLQNPERPYPQDFRQKMT